MILIRRNIAISFFFLFTLSIAAMGVYGYRTMAGGGDASPEGKAEAERFLYIAIIGVSVIAVTFLFTAGRTLSLYRELDKMIELNKRGDFSPELSMKKLGSIGERITLLYFTLNSLNEKRSLKISSLSSLSEFLVDNVELPLFVTDVRGIILYVSRNFAESTEKNRTEVLNRSVENLYPDVEFRDALVELHKKKTSVEIPDLATPLTLVGVLNRMNELSYVVWVFEKGARLQVDSVKPTPDRKRGRRLQQLLGRRARQGTDRTPR